MKFKSFLIAAFAVALSCAQAFGQATILPPGETCWSALAPTSGGSGNTGTGFIGLLGSITGGSGYVNGTYGGVPLTGGSGTNATANITVSGGSVTQVVILNPGLAFVVGDTLSASNANLGGSGTGFSVPVSSVSLNYALAGGSVGFYIPSTLTFKQTWQNSGQTILNQNPVPLDANGCAIIYGAGIYREIVKDSLGNTVYDQLTASTGSGGIFWAGTSAGTGNAITVTDASFSNQDGATIQFRASAANTGPTTISVSGGGAIAIVKDTASGPAALSGGEIGIGNTPILTYDATGAEFHIVNPAATSSTVTTSSLSTPQGYLNLIGQATGGVVQTGDVTGATVLYYSPFVGSIVPIFNGSAFVNTQFSELTMSLTAAGSPSNNIQDACVFSNNGVPTLVLGPSWTTATAGAGSRGTGAGTAQITKLQGIWVNAVSIIGYNGLSSYTIPASQCTYVGSVYIDATAGQVSAYRSWGQNRKFGIWNAYNRQPIIMQAGDPTNGWSYIGGIRASNNSPASYSSTEFNVGSGIPSNGIGVFTGLAEEQTNIAFDQTLAFPMNNNIVTGQIYIGINSFSNVGKAGHGTFAFGSPETFVADITARYVLIPTLGLTNVIELESGTTNAATFNGTTSSMLLVTSYRG